VTPCSLIEVHSCFRNVGMDGGDFIVIAVVTELAD
jgi:hypothetical protein